MKNYKKLYEETKSILDKYQNEIVLKLVEKDSTPSEERVVHNFNFEKREPIERDIKKRRLEGETVEITIYAKRHEKINLAEQLSKTQEIYDFAESVKKIEIHIVRPQYGI